MNETLQLIHNRRSIRKFRPDPIEEEKLDAVVQAGRYAPSGGNHQNSHFIVVTNREIHRELIALVEQEFAKMQVDENAYRNLKVSVSLARKGGYDFMFSAPVLIVVANRRDYANCMADSACALENMMIAAASLGLGACWVNQLHWLTDNPVIRRKLEECSLGGDEVVCGSLALGYPDYERITERELTPRERIGNRVDYVK
ncbi:nitroreductase family protein [Feifania hominis]|uniref:Nitroreductase n=1 Tax=Feifania hominis TaxID=2763660 RepID=A0A926HPA9_9FIRM|nr:nitroreductase [Feifania hominis]MBC8535082.1 nitroreductase [Feifania hominis]